MSPGRPNKRIAERDLKPSNVIDHATVRREIDPARFRRLVGLLADLLDAPTPEHGRDP